MLRRYHVISVSFVLLAIALGIVVTVRAQAPAPPSPGAMWDGVRNGLFGPSRPPQGQRQGQGQGQRQGQGQDPNYPQGQYRRPYQQPGQRPPQQTNQGYPQGGQGQQSGSPGWSDRMQRWVGEPPQRTKQGQGKKTNKTNPQATRLPPTTQYHAPSARDGEHPARRNPPTRSRRATIDRQPTQGREPMETEREREQDAAQTVPRRPNSARSQTEERAIIFDSGATSSRRTRTAPHDDEASDAPSEPADDSGARQEPSGGTSRRRGADGEPSESQREPAASQPGIEMPQLNSPREARTPVAPDTVSSRVGQPPDVQTRPRQEPSAPGNNVLSRRQGAALVVETLGPRRIVLDKEASYRIVLRNLSDVAEGHAQLTIQVPSWADIVSATPSRGKVQLPAQERRNEGIRWEVQSLRAGGHEELVLKLIPRESRALDLAVTLQSAPVDSQFSVDVRHPKLQLNIAGPREVNFGEKAVYELTFSNPGTADAENVLVRLLPIDPGDEADTHEIGTIAAGSRQTVEIELVARQPGTLAIVAEATAEGGVKTDARKDVVVLKPELRIAVKGPKFRYARTVATYTIRITNPGNALARNLQLGAMLPVQSTFVSASGGGAPKANEASQIVWKVPDIQAGGEQVFELKCELEKSGANRVQVAVLGEGDLRDTNFISTDVEALASLDLEVNDPKGPMPVGEDVPYDVIVHNRGGKSADNVQVLVFFSDGVEPVQVHGHRHQLEAGKVILDAIPKLGPGEHVTIKIVARAQKAGSHVFRTEVHCPSLSVKLSKQGTTRFYGDDRKDDSGDQSEDNGPPPDSPATPGNEKAPGKEPAGKGPPKIIPSHPKPVDANKPPVLPGLQGDGEKDKE